MIFKRRVSYLERLREDKEAEKTYPFVIPAGLTPGRRRACQPFPESAVDMRNVVKASNNGWTVWPMDASIVGGPLFNDTEKSPSPVKARKADTSL